MSVSAKEVNIEKYDFEAYRKEEKPYAMILTDVIQNMPMERSKEFLLWIFLESQVETWKINKNHLTKYFNISERTYQRYMAWLHSVGLIEYRQNRFTDGSFGTGQLVVLNGTKFNQNAKDYRTAKIDGTDDICIESEQIVQANRTAISPHRQNTVVRSNGDNINTINTLETHNLKRKKTKGADGPSSSSFFDDLVSLKLKTDKRTDEEFTAELEHHLEHNSNPKLSKQQRASGLKTILTNLRHSGEEFKSNGYVDTKKEQTIRTERENSFNGLIQRQDEANGLFKRENPISPEKRAMGISKCGDLLKNLRMA